MQVKAVSMLKIADGQNLRTFFDIAKAVMSPETLKQHVEPHLASFSSSVLDFKKSAAAMDSSDSEVEVVASRAVKTPTPNRGGLKTPTTSSSDKTSADNDDSSSDED